MICDTRDAIDARPCSTHDNEVQSCKVTLNTCSTTRLIRHGSGLDAALEIELEMTELVEHEHVQLVVVFR